MTYSIIFDGNPADEKLRILGEGIEQHIESKFQNRINKQLAFFLQDEKGAIVGGAR